MACGQGRRGILSSLIFSSFPLLLLPFFFLNQPPTVDFSLNRPPTADFSLNQPLTDDFWRYRPIASGPRTGNLADRYVPPIPGGRSQNCKPWYGRYRSKLQTLYFTI
ncbi:hypothetical protein B296_00022378 [Ensete ventricosum]|uniref:Uncharacterized protein n=1 Tax=Ensete ventricosum TaxID=4639 RepID=A0A426YSS1_ENSVE|nr:hypothetical protein B296_00022378 [Ensete ventricosum]